MPPETPQPTFVPTPPPPQRVSGLLVITFGIILLLVLGGGYYWYFFLRQDSSMTRTDTDDALHRAHQTGNFSESIQQIDSEIFSGNFSSRGEEAHLKAMLAIDLHQRNQGDDRERAIRIYEDIIFSETYSPATRALILADLGLLMGNYNREYIGRALSGTSFEQFLSADTTSAGAAKTAVQILAASDALYPNAIAKLSMGYFYSVLLSGSGFEKNAENEITAHLMQELVQAAEPLMSSFDYDPSHVARMYLYKAVALSASNEVLGNVRGADIEGAYQATLDRFTEEEVSASYQLNTVILDARFFFATYLFRAEGEGREVDIAQILIPFGQTLSDSPFTYLTRSRFASISRAPQTNFMRVHAMELAAISPEFKQFLVSVGWSF